MNIEYTPKILCLKTIGMLQNLRK